MARTISISKPKKGSTTDGAKTNVVQVSSTELTITSMSIDNPDVVSFLSDKERPEQWVEKAVVVGCIGLKQMTIAENVDFVEKEFHKFLADARQAFEKQQTTIDEKLKLVFDMHNSKSMISQFKTYLEEQQDSFDIDNPESLFAKFKEFMEAHQEEFSDTVESTFSMSNKDSQFAKFQTYLDKSLDMHHKDSPLNQFKKLIDEYFDEKNGKIRTTMQEYFDQRKGRMKELLDASFDVKNEDSDFSQLLRKIKENSDLEEEAFEDMLDPNKTDSPIQLLKKSLLEEFEDLRERELKALAEHLKEIREKDLKEIREHILQEEAAEEAYEAGTAKGHDFETDMYIHLTELSGPYADNVSQTGGEFGSRGKVGDIVIDIEGDESNRIVVECKDDTSYRSSVPKTMREVQEALENRKGKFCLFIFKEQELMPPQLRPVKITDEYIITSAESVNLCIAYRLARLMLQKRSSGAAGIDIAAIQKELEGITANLNTISQMQSKITTIQNACTYIDRGLGSLHDDTEARIGRIHVLIMGNANDES